jgi:hypothetical protein
MRKHNIFQKLTLLSAAAIVLTFGSCKKDSEDEPTSVSKTGLLTSSGWVMKSAEIVVGTQSQDMYSWFDDCEKDDIIIFKTDKSIVEDEGATKCDPSDPQTTTDGTWALLNNDTELFLNFDDDDDDTVFKIKTLSSTDLSVEVTEFDSTFMMDVTLRFGFKHQ